MGPRTYLLVLGFAAMVPLLPMSAEEIWRTQELLKVPQVFEADQYPSQQVPGVRSLLFESVPYRGKPTRIFAYYGVPQGSPPAGGWPAVIVAHGGGGTAYAEYVKMWNKRGYAAMAMDFYGKAPAPGVPPSARQSVNDGFPDPYGEPAKEPEEEWSYHVVSTIILAHSLIRSFPEINPEKTALVGASWGGIHSCIAAGLDSRFKAVVAIYGCGFLSEGDDSISFHRKFREGAPWWDPSRYLPQARMPFFWIAGTNDEDFSPDMRQKSIDITPGTSSSVLVVGLGHSDEGLAYPPVAEMVDGVLHKAVKFPRLGRPRVEGLQARVTYETNHPAERADLCYTVDRGNRARRVWQTVPARLEDGSISATLPPDASAFFFNVYEKVGEAAPKGDAWPISSVYIERP